MTTLFFRFFFSLIIFTCNAFAQSFPSRHFDVDDGLTSNTVYDCEQDNRGFMWFATSAGVCRFDGKHFKRYTIDDGLSDNEVLKIIKDSKGRLWLFGFNSSVVVISGDSIMNESSHPILKQLRKGFFYNNFFENKAGEIFLNNARNFSAKVSFPDSLIELPIKEDIIFKTKYGYARRFIKGENDIKPVMAIDSFLMRNPASKVFYYKDSLLFFFTQDHLYQLNRSAKISNINLPLQYLKNALEVYCDTELNLWLTTYNNGVYKFSFNNGKYNYAGSFFNNENITSTFVDNEKNVWFTTHGNGVYLLPFYFRSVLTYSSANGLSANEAYAVYPDKQNRLWVGYRNGIVDIIENGDIRRINLTVDLKTIGRINQILYHPSDAILMASDIGLFLLPINKTEGDIFRFRFFNNDKRPVSIHNVCIKDIELTPDSTIRISCSESIHELSYSDILNHKREIGRLPFPNRRFYSVCNNPNGGFWFSDAGGLKKFENGNTQDLSSNHPLLKKRIVDMCLYQSKLLLSIEGYGLMILENDKPIAHISEKEGLLSNHCGKIFSDGKYAWVCSTLGLSLIDLSKENNFVKENISVADGLSSGQVNNVYVANGKIYAATQKGVSILTMSELKPKNNLLPNTFITKASWGEKNLLGLSNPEIEYEKGSIVFSFVAPQFTFPENIIYQYRLNENAWSETKNTSVEFNSLQPDKYTFSIRSRSASFKWSNTASFKFKIPQPFYMAWWFYAAIILLVIAVLTFVYRSRLKRLKKEQQVKILYEQQINRFKIQALQAMMNPHFVFNSLNAIQQQVNLGNTDKARTYLSRFAQLLRMNLQTVNSDFVPLDEELERIKLYLETEKIRLEEKLSYNISKSEKVPDDILIPSMIIQPFVENSIWHGIMPSEKNGTVKISIDKKSEQLIIEIEDDGIGVEASKANRKSDAKSEHYGIKLISDRLKTISENLKQDCSVELLDKTNSNFSGTIVKIKLPFLLDE